MLADPGHIAANAAAVSAKPCYKVEVQWDGANWTAETANTLLGGSCQAQIVDPFEGLSSMGGAPIGSANIVVDNYDGRFSEGRAGSQAATYPLYGKGIRISAGYYHGATAEYVGTFTGRIAEVVEAERSVKAKITGHDLGFIPMQQKYSTMMYADVPISAWISTLATLAGVASTDLEQSLTIAPYAYLDDDYALDEIKRAAASEGGIAFFDVAGKLRFWNAAHWCNAGSVATFAVADFAELEPKRAYDDIYNVISVEYQPRGEGQVDEVYGLDRSFIIPPGGSKTMKLKLRKPLRATAVYKLSACSGGGDDMTAAVSVAPTMPDTASSWTATFSNSNTQQAAFITRFDVYGAPIEGRPAETHELDQSGAGTARRKDIRGNWYIQTEAQAKLIASVLGQRFKNLRLAMTLRGVPANPLLEVGDVVTVQATRTGINRTAIITNITHNFRAAYTMDIGLSDFTDFYPFTGYFVVGTSVLGAAGGRLFA